MTSLAEVSTVARNMVRDFGSFFEINYASPGATLRLPHPLVEADSVSVINNTDASAVENYAVNSRNGLLKLPNPGSYPAGVYVSGMYFEWFLDDDLEFFAQMVVNEHMYSRPGVDLGSIEGVEVEVMGMGTLVQALWSLLAEFATDIDVSSPEGMNIPAHQRYQQLQSLIQYWEKRYNDKAAMLNVGLNKMEMMTLRRISRHTGRYVPLYRGREIDNPRPPVRVRPPIDPIYPTPFEQEDAYWAAQHDSMSEGTGEIGWGSLGSSGG